MVWSAQQTGLFLLRGKLIAIHAFFQKQEKYQINNLTLYLKELDKEGQMKSKVNRRKEIIKIKVD